MGLMDISKYDDGGFTTVEQESSRWFYGCAKQIQHLDCISEAKDILCATIEKLKLCEYASSFPPIHEASENEINDEQNTTEEECLSSIQKNEDCLKDMNTSNDSAVSTKQLLDQNECNAYYSQNKNVTTMPVIDSAGMRSPITSDSEYHADSISTPSYYSSVAAKRKNSNTITHKQQSIIESSVSLQNDCSPTIINDQQSLDDSDIDEQTHGYNNDSDIDEHTRGYNNGPLMCNTGTFVSMSNNTDLVCNSDEQMSSVSDKLVNNVDEQTVVINEPVSNIGKQTVANNAGKQASFDEPIISSNVQANVPVDTPVNKRKSNKRKTPVKIAAMFSNPSTNTMLPTPTQATSQHSQLAISFPRHNKTAPMDNSQSATGGGSSQCTRLPPAQSIPSLSHLDQSISYQIKSTKEKIAKIKQATMDANSDDDNECVVPLDSQFDDERLHDIDRAIEGHLRHLTELSWLSFNKEKSLATQCKPAQQEVCELYMKKLQLRAFKAEQQSLHNICNLYI